MDTFIESSFALADKIKECKSELITLLCQYESYETALHEIERSIKTLEGFSRELSDIYRTKKSFEISVFFPINLPLYSLILFGVAPAAFAKCVYIRPALVVFEILEEIIQCIDLEKYIKNISVCRISRREFLDECVTFSQVVIFNGRYENVQELITRFPRKIFIYNGRGINPAIVGPLANINLAVKKIVDMRVFNSGQDCAGVDAIFVEDSIYATFSNLLKKELKKVLVGDYHDKAVRIGKMQRPEYLHDLEEFILNKKNLITVLGIINRTDVVVTPFVVEQKLNSYDGSFPEFFAPIFHLIRYRSNEELLDFLSRKTYSDYAMYASVFGTSDEIAKQIPNTRILVDKNVNDVEIGNEAYGGYGPKANFVYKDGQYEIRPILISQELMLL